LKKRLLQGFAGQEKKKQGNHEALKKSRIQKNYNAAGKQKSWGGQQSTKKKRRRTLIGVADLIKRKSIWGKMDNKINRTHAERVFNARR